MKQYVAPLLLGGITFLVLTAYFENQILTSGQLLTLPSLGDLTGSDIHGCTTNSDCTPLCQSALNGNGTCINGNCQCNACPIQTVALALVIAPCIGSPLCPCPVQTDGSVGGPSTVIYANSTAMQGHICMISYRPVKYTCLCLCAQLALNSTLITGGLPTSKICPIAGI